MKNETMQPSATEQALAKIEFTDAKAFEAIVAAISGLADKYRNLKITDTKSYKIVVSGIAEMRSLRIAVENRRKEKKADILAAGRQIDGGAKKIAELLWPIENELKKTKDTEDVRKDAIRIEKEQAEKERIESIQSGIAAFPPNVSKLPQLLKMTAPEIQEMQDTLTAIEIDIEVYQEFTPEAIKAKTDKTKLLQEYYIARITADAEAAKQKADEEALLARVKAQRIIDEKNQADRETKQKIEDDRLAKIREEQKAEADKLLAEQEKIEVDRQVLKKEQDRMENERLERERIEQEKIAQKERDRLAKIEAEEQEKARIKQEAKEEAERKQVEAEEKKRLEALRPDKKALELYLSAIQKSFMAIEEPLIKTPSGNITLTKIQTNIEEFFNNILDIAEDM